jgi:hypothetical protein
MIFAWRRLLLVLWAAAATAGLAPAAGAAQNFMPLKLPHGVQIEIPRNWQILSANQRINLDTFAQTLAERAGAFDASSDLTFAASYYDERGKTAALLNFRYYPELNVTQAEAKATREVDTRELDTTLRDAMAKFGKVSGYTILAWNGTTKQVINGATAFVTDYRRDSLNDNGKFRVRLVRVFNAGKSFTLTISYREAQEFLLRPICDRIISSLHI